MLYFIYFFNSHELLLRGALTNRAWSTAYSNRSWELCSVRTIDILDSLNSSIELNIRGNQLLRILPSIDYTLNGEWISDRIRYSADAFRMQRLDVPLVVTNNSGRDQSFKTLVSTRVIGDNCFKNISWNVFFKALSSFSFKNINYFKGGEKIFFPKPFNTFYLNMFERSGVPLDILTCFWVDRLHDFFCINPLVFLMQYSPNFYDNTFLFSSKGTLGEELTTSPLNSKDINLGLKKYSFIFLVIPSLTMLNPVFLDKLYNLIKDGVSLYTFGPGNLNTFSSLSNKFKHLGSLSDYKRFVDGRHWLSITINALSNERSAVFVVSDNPRGSVFLDYTKNVLHKSKVFNVDVFPFFHTNSSIHSSLLGLPNAMPAESADSFTTEIFTKLSLSLVKGSCFYKRPSFNYTFLPGLSLYFASHPTSIMGYCRASLPISTFYENALPYINMLGNCRNTKLAFQGPGLSISSDILMVLLYSLFFKKQTINIKSQFLNYFIDYFLKVLLLTEDTGFSFKLLRAFVALGAKNQLSFALFLKDFLSPLVKKVYLNKPYLNFNVNDSSGFVLKYKISIYSTSALGFNGYLGFEDELTVHSLSLWVAKLRLTEGEIFNIFLK